MRGVHNRLSMPGAGGIHAGAAGDDTYLLHERRRRACGGLPGRWLHVNGGLREDLLRWGGGGRCNRLRVLLGCVGGSGLSVLLLMRGILLRLFLRHARQRASFRSSVDHVRRLVFSVRLRVCCLDRGGPFRAHLVLLELRLGCRDRVGFDFGH